MSSTHTWQNGWWWRRVGDVQTPTRVGVNISLNKTMNHYIIGNVNAHMCGRSPSRPHASISVGNFVHESWNKSIGFLCHVGRGACAVCESVRPHVGFHPAVSVCHSEACGGTGLRPHATPEPRLPSTTSRTSPLLPSQIGRAHV